MPTITELIQPIRLLSGSHADTGHTGLGCFMNVIAYLNGEPQITDKSPCVCVTVKPIAIWLNDYMTDQERLSLIPYIERAMGSATTDQAELSRRALRAVKMAEEMSDLAAASAASAAWAERAERAASAASAAWAASAASAASAAWAASAASAASYQKIHKQIIESALRYLDDVLPKAPVCDVTVVERARQLMELVR